MSAAWTFDAFVDGVATAVAARPGITAMTPRVHVLTYWPTADAPISDALVLGYAGSDDNEPASLGNGGFKEFVTVECLIRINRPGAGDTPANQARERAMAILDEVSGLLRSTSVPQVGVQTVTARISDRRIDQFPTIGGTPARICEVQFNIRYEARTART